MVFTKYKSGIQSVAIFMLILALFVGVQSCSSKPERFSSSSTSASTSPKPNDDEEDDEDNKGGTGVISIDNSDCGPNYENCQCVLCDNEIPPEDEWCETGYISCPGYGPTFNP